MNKTKKVFNDNCPIVPEIVADAVVNEAAKLFDFLGYDAFFGDKGVVLIRLLAERAETTCQADRRFRQKILGPGGNLGRDRLYAFMRHWLAGLLLNKYGERVREGSARRAFDSFACGADPSGVSRVRVF